MMNYLFSILILLISCSKQKELKLCSCEENLIKLLQQDIAKSSEEDIIGFLCCINNDLKDNIELSQMTNELTFDLLAHNTELFIHLLSQHSNIYDQEILISIIGEPLTDKYSSDYLIEKIYATKESSSIKEQIINTLKGNLE